MINQLIKNVNNVFGEKSIRHRLIVFDDVSGFADDSKKFVSFLTVACKYSCNCVYIFHTIYPEKSNWRTILSQTNIYNIFPATVSLNNVRKILEGACIRKTSKYISQASLWISRRFIELANRNDKVYLTLDCSNTYKDGPGRFRTDADNPDNQLCYFNSVNDEQFYNEFVSKRIKNSDSENDFHFQIVEVKSKTNKNISFDATNELKQLNKNDTKRGRERVKTSFGSKRTSRISESSGMFADNARLPTSDSSYSQSIAENDGRIGKTAKPGFLLKR